MKPDGNKPRPNYANRLDTNKEQEPEQPRSVLADLFKRPEDDDPEQLEAYRDELFNRKPQHTNKSGSFTL